MLITFLRHGQSEHNAGLTNHLDSALTPLGVSQALAAAHRFQQEEFDSNNTIALVSPLKRTLQTLEPTVKTLNLYAELFYDVREFFSTRNEGYKVFVGLPIPQIRQQYPWVEVGKHMEGQNEWWPDCQEDEIQLYNRSCVARDYLIDQYLTSEKQLLIVSHADPIGRMIEAFLRVAPNLEGPPWSGNCGVTRLKVTDSQSPAELIFLNDLSHLAKNHLLSPR